MDFLRHDQNGEAEFEDELAPELDSDVFDRLSAYGADTRGAPAESDPAEPPSWTGEPAEPPSLSFGGAAESHADVDDEPEPELVADQFEPVTEQYEEPLLFDEETAPFVTSQVQAVDERRLVFEAAEEPEVPDVVADASGVTDVDEPSGEVEEEILEVVALVEVHAEPVQVEAQGEPLLESHADADPEADDTAAEQELESVSEPPAQDELAVTGEAAPTEKRRALSFRRRRSETPDGAHGSKPKKEKADKRDRKAKRLVGLKIGASQIAAAEVLNNGVPEVVGLSREPLAPGVVVFGEIRDPDALGDALKEFFEAHKLPKRGVRLGISNNRVGVRIFDVDGVTDPGQLENAIRFRAEEVLPIPLDQAVLDYAILEESELDDGTPRKRILLVVAYREVVERYLQACTRAGLQVVGIDHEAFALLRSLEVPEDRDPAAGALVAVAIGHDRTTMAVSTGRQCEFARVLDWGGWSLNIAVARELHRAPSEVENVKRHLSFAQNTAVDGLDSVEVAKARDGMKRALEAFARELVASLQFYQAQPGALGIGEVVLTGGTAHMDGLPEALGEIIGVPIRLGDPFKRLKVGAKVAEPVDRGSLAIAIGLGIED